MVTDNPYRHIRNFTTICNTVRQEGVLDEWFKCNLFPYSLAGNAKTWYSFASFVVEGNWNKLTKKFCEKFFPISKVQHLRRQVINFMQGEEEGIDKAWDRFNGLIEQGPRLGFTGDVFLHTFSFPNPWLHATRRNVCRWGSHGENTHGSRPTSTKN
jgi:hypothetical protein